MLARFFKAAPVQNPADWDAQENLRSIQGIPLDQLPDGPARRELLRLSATGAEVYAYRPAHQAEYVIWHFEGDPTVECRRSVSEWAEWRGVALRDGGH